MDTITITTIDRQTNPEARLFKEPGFFSLVPEGRQRIAQRFERWESDESKITEVP